MPSVTTSQLVPVPAGKKRKLDSGTATQQKQKGTTADHILVFLKDTMDIDKYEYLKGTYFVLDNAFIHSRADVMDLIT